MTKVKCKESSDDIRRQARVRNYSDAMARGRVDGLLQASGMVERIAESYTYSSSSIGPVAIEVATAIADRIKLEAKRLMDEDPGGPA